MNGFKPFDSNTSSAQKIEYITQTFWTQLAPVSGTTYSTGIDPAILDPNIEVTVIAFIDAAGESNAIFNQARVGSALSYPDVRISADSELLLGNGDVTVGFWYEIADNEIKVEIDVDGGGKVVTSVVLNLTEIVSVPV